MGGMATVAFLDFGTAGVAPWWVTTLLVLLWLVFFAVACRWFMRHPGRVALLPVLLFVLWLATILYGTRALGWS
jgi:hypothetical protein